MTRISRWCLNIVYVGIIALFSPIVLYRALVHGKYREGFKEKFLGHVPELSGPPKNGKRLWFHAVSVGEVNVLRPLLKLIREEKPDWDCVISTTSLTGMRLAEKLYGEQHRVFYCPLDFSWAVESAMQRIKPDALVLVEQEIWPNLFALAKKHGVKIALVNGRFGESGYRRYKRFRFFFKPVFEKIDLLAVQSETYAGWFHCVGAHGDAIEITGSMKFDGAQFDRGNAKTRQLAELAGISENDIVFLAGSTQDPEESYALEIFESLAETWPQLKLILVPRHPERFEAVAALLDAKNADWIRRTQLEHAKPGQKKRIILVDCVGELGAWWGLTHIAFVGGSMGKRGGQNMIEPAAYGAAVSFGPNTKNFRDIVELLLHNEAAIVVHDQEEMRNFVQQCLEEPPFAEELGRRASTLVQNQLGATRKTLSLLENLLRFPTRAGSVSGRKSEAD